MSRSYVVQPDKHLLLREQISLVSLEAQWQPDRFSGKSAAKGCNSLFFLSQLAAAEAGLAKQTQQYCTSALTVVPQTPAALP